jgi:hypothetical protein
MANVPLINATVKITAKDINGNNVPKQFNSVSQFGVDYNEGMVKVVDTTGTFYFSAQALSSLTYTITPNPGGSHVIVTS